MPDSTVGLSRGHVTDKDLVALCSSLERRFRQSRIRIDDCRRLVNGDLRAPMAASFHVEGYAEAFRIDTATKYTLPRRLASMMQRKPPRARRNPAGSSERADQVASEIEQPVNAIMRQVRGGKLWDGLIDLLLMDGECAAITQPATSSWLKTPTMFDASGGMVDKYRRDAQGRSSRERYYRDNPDRSFQVDERASRQAFTQARDDFLARRLPVLVRLIPASDCWPLLNPNGELDGLVVKQKYLASELIRRNYLWGDDEAHLSPTSSRNLGGLTETQNADPEVDLIEAWLVDADGRPYVAYSIDGKKATRKLRDGRIEPAVLDLYAEYGLTRLPIRYGYGQVWSGISDPNRRGIPFCWPFARSWLGADALLTGQVVSLWFDGFPSYGLRPDKDTMPSAWLEDDAPRTFDIEPLKVQTLPGELVKIGGASSMNPAVVQLVQFLLGDNKAEAPEPQGAGGNDASGYAQTVARRYTEDAEFQVLEGGRQMWEGIAEDVLEVSCVVAEKFDQQILVYGNPPTPAAQVGVQSSVQQLLELDPAKVGDSYKLTAEFPHVFGENLATTQQAFQVFKEGGLLLEEWRTMIGDADPWAFRAKKIVQDFYDSDLGRQDAMRRAAEILGDQHLKELFELQQAGRVDAEGRPLALAAGLQARGPMQAPPPPGAPTATMDMGNPAQNQLNGIVSGAIQSQAGTLASAAGAPPGLAPTGV